MERAGFGAVRTWLEPHPIVPDDPAQYLSTIVLGAQVQQLPADLRTSFVAQVIDRLPAPLTLDYVRLNIDALLGKAGSPTE